ncbi:MAG: hypothetical protein KDK66_08065 [Deltaproteobacteria bacterium]|nr:hypothetical protein [Deltaproteobacteria bacterium]
MKTIKSKVVILSKPLLLIGILLISSLQVELALAKETSKDSKASIKELPCFKELKAQQKSIKKDSLAKSENFEKYPVQKILKTPPLKINVKSNPFAKEFRTILHQEVKEKGINFAGRYSLVELAMTGWGKSHFIIDGKNGQVYLFPYYAVSLDFRKDSHLIVMNPKSFLKTITSCLPMGQQEAYNLRSFYFLWKDNQLTLIGPKDISPPANQMWTEYFKDPK